MRNWLVIIILMTGGALSAQDTKLDTLFQQETQVQQEKQAYIPATIFRSSRVLNGHSTETLPAGVLDIKIQHRFGYISDGWNEFFGLDNATIRLGGDYGLTNRCMIGLGRATYEKQWDGFVKYKVLEQHSGKTNMPLSLTLLASAMVQTMPDADGQEHATQFIDRLYYAGQLLVARKFGNVFSLQFMPTLVHYNLVPSVGDPNDIVSMGIATSLKITKNASFTTEYYYNLPRYKFKGTENSLSVGFDIETAGHVFQLLFTNGSGVAERPFISESTGKFFDGDIRIGFNLNRSFQLKKPKNQIAPKAQ